MKYLDPNYFNTIYNLERSLKSIPTFGAGNDMRRPIDPPLPTHSSNKPNKRRAKVKAGRKANLKNRK